VRKSILALVVAVSVSGCAGTSADNVPPSGEADHGWLSTSGETVVLLRWTESESGDISGVIQLARLEGSVVIGESSAVSGTTSGGVITLSIDGVLNLGSPVTGEENDGRITLYWPNDRGLLEPVVFHEGTIAAYNEAVAELEVSASEVAQAEHEAKVAADQAQAGIDTLNAADDQLAQAAAGLQAAIHDFSSAEEWAGYALDSAQSMLDTLRDDVIRLEEMVQTDPLYAEADLEAAESTYEALELDVNYVKGQDGVGAIESAVSALSWHLTDVTAALDKVRWAEDQYLNSEFAPYDASAELALVAEAQLIVDDSGPSSIQSFESQAEVLLDEGTSLMSHARVLVTGG
jgi:hypothetical protein